MGYTNFQNGITPINDDNLNAMQKGLMELVFPVGSTYITQSNTNPNTILNFGTWERLKGKVCLGLDEDDTNMNTIGKTGGEKEHTLTVNEMPSHTHTLNNATLLNRNISGTGGAQGSTTVQGATVTANNSGGGQAHNNLQPYEVVGYMWIRRS